MKATITSVKNKQIREYQKLRFKKHRDKVNMFIVENWNVVQEIQNSDVIVSLFTVDSKYPGTLVSENVMKKLSSQKSVPKVLAVVRKTRSEYAGKKVLALDNLQDPKNVGALVRSAKAFGFTDVLVKGVDIYSPKVLQASLGAFFQINVLQVSSFASYFRHKTVVGTLFKAQNKVDYRDYVPSNPFVILLGNEGRGVSKSLTNLIDVNVFIPINFESLNVVVAGSILMNQYR